MNKKPEIPFGVYSNLYVVCFHVRRLHHVLKSSIAALLSLEVPGVALDGDLRKRLDFVVVCRTRMG